MIYLDHAATTPVAREVADTMYDVLLNGSGNPSSQYPYGAAAKKRLEADRAVIAAALGCKPDELYFTSCGTESDNWAIRLAAHQNRRVAWRFTRPATAAGTSSPPPWSTAPCSSLAVSWSRRAMPSPISRPTVRGISPRSRSRTRCARIRRSSP